jgi:hypothetical protein
MDSSCHANQDFSFIHLRKRCVLDFRKYALLTLKSAAVSKTSLANQLVHS